jgi:hypothetical protein
MNYTSEKSKRGSWRRGTGCEDPLLPAQGKVAQVKIMLIHSSLDKDENDTKKNQVDKLKFILICFISLLSIGHRNKKRDATW